MPLGDVAGRGWTLSDLPTPVMVLRERALAHNLSLMAEYCRAWGVDIAPHGKTTMAPQLWDRQLGCRCLGDHGGDGRSGARDACVGRSARAARERAGRSRVDRVGRRAAGRSRVRAPLLRRLGSTASTSWRSTCEHVDAHRPLPVLVELGFDGGRTGCRTIPEAVHVAGRVASSDVLRLAGVAGYEGTICQDRSPECLARVLSYLDRLRELTRTMIDAGTLRRRRADRRVRRRERVLRSGGRPAPWPVAGGRRRPRRAPLRLLPDPRLGDLRTGLAVAGARRRRAGSSRRWSSGARCCPGPSRISPSSGSASATCRSTSTCRCRRSCARPPAIPVEADGPADDRRAERPACVCTDRSRARRSTSGDLVRCGLSHPCTAFDKWRHIPVLDDDDRVIDAVATFF